MNFDVTQEISIRRSCLLTKCRNAVIIVIEFNERAYLGILDLPRKGH